MWSDIIEVYFSSQSLQDKYAFFYSTLHRLCTERVMGLTADYNDFFSRLQAVCRLTNYRLTDVDRFRWRAHRVMTGKDEPVGCTYYEDVKAFVDAFAHFSETTIPDNLRDDINHQLKMHSNETSVTAKPALKLSALTRSARFVVCGKDEHFVYAVSGNFPEQHDCVPEDTQWRVASDVNEQTANAAELLEVGMQFNAISFTSDEQSLIITPEMIIIEPDYLVDVTGVCRCLKHYGDSPLNYLLAKFEDDITNKDIVLGNIAGQFLDDCINNPSATYLESVRKAFKQSLIAITTCSDIDRAFFDDCKRQFDNIKRTVGQLLADPGFVGAEGNIQLEPSFFCEALGLQGRFDFLQCDFRNLIEMKSGKADDYHHRARAEHIMQMYLYKEMLFHNVGKSQLEVNGYVFYSKYPMLLEQRTVREHVHHMMQIRNSIVCMERRLKEGVVGELLKDITVEDLNLNGVDDNFWKNSLKPGLVRLLEPLQNMDGLLAEYFFTFYTFIAREHYLSKVGDARMDSSRGMANLWNADLDTKLQNGDIMIDLVPAPESMQNDHSLISTIVLMKPSVDDEQKVSKQSPNFRVGDPVILYRRNSASESATTQQVVRCCVATYDNDTITLQLNYPQSNPHFLSSQCHYAIEHDYMDASFRQQYRGLYALLKTSPERRDLLLGRRLPENDPSVVLKGKYLNEQIDSIVLRAKQARDYFLLVGPPGTGKTSVALKSMIDECMLEHKSLLLLSYTNRAVDEICETLGDRQYIRLGRELSCDPRFHSHLFEMTVGDDVNRDSVRNLFLNCPIVVGTVSSVTGSKALFRIRQFDVAIFDEASQILEPQLLSILCDEINGKPSIAKFIMIGDHKQLPAVVVQDTEVSKVQSDLLRTIGLTDCRNSLFERLHGQVKHITDSEGRALFTATLNRQGRMHPDIAEFASDMFYEGELRPVGLPHQNSCLDFQHYSADEELVATKRLAFINIPLPSALERQPKLNQAEALEIARIVGCAERLAQKNNVEFDASRHVGIIVPFRRQIVAVRQALYAEGIKEADAIMIDTVERYQGSQKDIIIYGTTITRPYELDTLSVVVNQDGSLVDRKLNVALTRARKQLFVLGNKQLLSKNELYRKLIEYAEKSGEK